MGLVKNIDAKKSTAQDLFINSDKSQKDISEIIGVSEKTISKWKKEGDWEQIKGAQLLTPTKILDELYRKTYDLSKQDKISADELVKLASAIEKLKNTKSTVVNYINTFKEFSVWLITIDPVAAKKLNHYQSMFIDSKIKEGL